MSESLNDFTLDTAQAAALLGVSWRTVGTWARTGKIPSIKTSGNQYRISTSYVQAIMDGEAVMFSESAE